MIDMSGVDPLLLHAWLSARSVARGLPAPVPDHGGYRVDTGSEGEVARWVFAQTGPGLERLARSISQPRHPLKLCGAADRLQAALPDGWALHAPGYVMQATGTPPARPLADGYRIEVRTIGMVTAARILSATGTLAASGYAAEANDVFAYDRITTDPAHRRKGLGHVLMRTLHDARRHSSAPEILVATEEGRALYATLGWTVISPYSTASIP